MLIAQDGKKLIGGADRGSCPTRWSSTYLMVSCLVEVRPHLSYILEELVWDGLQASEWKLLESIRNLLEPFAEHTAFCSGEEYTTIANVLLALMDLSFHLEEVYVTYSSFCIKAVHVNIIMWLGFKFDHIIIFMCTA